jgi:hypothetical protein
VRTRHSLQSGALSVSAVCRRGSCLATDCVDEGSARGGGGRARGKGGGSLRGGAWRCDDAEDGCERDDAADGCDRARRCAQVIFKPGQEPNMRRQRAGEEIALRLPAWTRAARGQGVGEQEGRVVGHCVVVRRCRRWVRARRCSRWARAQAACVAEASSRCAHSRVTRPSPSSHSTP